MYHLFHAKKQEIDLTIDYKKIVKDKLDALTSGKLISIFNYAQSASALPNEVSGPKTALTENTYIITGTAKMIIGSPYYLGKIIRNVYKLPEINQDASVAEMKAILAKYFLNAGKINNKSLNYYLLDGLFGKEDADLSVPLINMYKDLLLEECGYKLKVEANPFDLSQRSEIEALYGMDVFSNDTYDDVSDTKPRISQ